MDFEKVVTGCLCVLPRLLFREIGQGRSIMQLVRNGVQFPLGEGLPILDFLLHLRAIPVWYLS